jgi:predicted anti-sigma-YlaC factor YlaD
LERIYATQEVEISCSDCFNLIANYVEREMAGEAVETQLPIVKQHLEQCQVCQEEYELLRELVAAE